MHWPAQRINTDILCSGELTVEFAQAFSLGEDNQSSKIDSMVSTEQNYIYKYLRNIYRYLKRYLFIHP